jgi:hypothetical protein
LCTKALDETAIALGNELGLMLATVRANKTVSQDSKSRYADINLSHAYEVLVGAFGASKLTAWGMTARGRPPKKSLAQRLGLSRGWFSSGWSRQLSAICSRRRWPWLPRPHIGACGPG